MEDTVEDAVEAPVEKLIEDEVVNAVEDPGYGKRAIELNSTCGNPEMVRADMMSRLQCLWTTYPRSHFKCLVSPVYDSHKPKNYSHVTGTRMARVLHNLLAFTFQSGDVMLLLLLLLLLLLSVINTQEGKLGQN